MTDIKSLNYDELVTYMAGLGRKEVQGFAAISVDA